jgi:hypothetical protein
LLRPCVSELQRKRAVEPSAAMPRDDNDHQHAANDTAESEIV